MYGGAGSTRADRARGQRKSGGGTARGVPERTAALCRLAQLQGRYIARQRGRSVRLSITTAGIVLGSLLSTVLLRFMGPRRLMMLHGPPAMAGWLLVAAARDLRIVIAGRLLVSFCNATTLPCYTAYICDIVAPRLRGRLTALPEVFCSLGLLIGYGVGATMHWSYMAAILGVLPNVAITVGFLWLPESPSWLATHMRHEEAAGANRFYKGDFSGENKMDGAAPSAEKTPDHDGTLGVLRKILRREALLPILLVTGVMMFQILSGMLAVLSYSVTIFQLSGTAVNEYVCAVIIGVTRLASNVLASGLVDRFGRRPLLIGSSLLSAASLATLGGFFWAQQHGQLPASGALDWLPVTALIIYISATSFGIGPVTWMLMGELVPADVSSLANGAILTVWGLVYFSVLQAFPYMTRWLGAQGTFWTFASCCAGLAVYAALLLPETRGIELSRSRSLFARQQQRNPDASQDKKVDDPRGARPRHGLGALPAQRNALQLESQEVIEMVRRRAELCAPEFRTPAAN